MMTHDLPHFRRAALRLTIASVLLLGAVAARALPISAVQFSYTTHDATSFNTQSQTMGWTFSVSKTIKVTSLGIFDPLQDGLADPHAVGLWSVGTATSTSGTLLGSVTIPEGTAATLDGMFRYTNVAPILLTPGHFYVVGAHYTGINGYGSIDPDPADRDGFLNQYYYYGETYASGITYLNARSSSQQTTGMQFPYYKIPINSNPPLGANFRFTTVPETLPAIVPAAVLFGLLAFAARSRRWRTV